MSWEIRHADCIGTCPTCGQTVDFVEVGPTDCWIWQRALSPSGYGQKSRGRREMGRAHRLIYEELVEPIPDGLELDHLCRNRACVNPGHTEPVTRAENNRRAGKLTHALVRRARAEGWATNRLAWEAGIHPTTAWRALIGTTWSDI